MASGNIHGALTFNGSDESVSIPHSSFYNFGDSDFAIDIAIKTSASDGTILQKIDTGVGIKLFLESDVLKFTLNGDTYSFTTTVNDDAWYKLHFSANRSKELVYCFVNGALDGALNTSDGTVNNSVALTLAYDGSSDFFAGTLSDFRLSDRTRETKAFRPDSRQHDDDKDTMALFHFNSGAGSTVYDMSVTRNHGTITSGTPQAMWAIGPYLAEPIQIVREYVWLAIDASQYLTDFLSHRLPKASSDTTRLFDGKYRFREGDVIPSVMTPGNTPAVFVTPGTLPGVEIQTVAYHNMPVPVHIEGILHHRAVYDITFFWWVTLKAIWQQYDQGSTAGRFNWVGIQHMTPQGPSFEVAEENGMLFSKFRETIMFDVNHNFIDGI